MSITLQERATGALAGLALGDALGTTLEFQARPARPVITDMVGGGPFHLQPGQWTDDTSMMLCLADSLIENGGSDPADQMRRYINWRDRGHNSCTGTCFDIGNTVARALRVFEQTGNGLAGSTSESSAGNGSLMRVAPVALLAHGAGLPYAMALAAESSATTHAERRCIDACQYMTFLIYTLLNASGQPEKSALLADDAPGLGQYLAAMHPDTRRIISGSYRHKTRDEISSSGYVLSSLEAALWCFWHSGTFAEGALLAANLGDDADTIAAIYGQLAGAWYGYPALPESWLARLAWKDEISHRALLLLARQNSAALHAFIRDCRAVEDLSLAFGPYSERHGLMMPGFNWPDWIAERRSLLEPAQIAQASVAECLSLITAINRGERFNAGLRVDCAQNGVLQAIVDRLAALSGYAE
ncbi:ADP-ribosylglycohydrolase family protein [uncultured Pluralibacter sp.]|uniref:ADP-ribosylglycohydrolase family protein n=1 Tax=uncultured Pluralibacter sp. TaxID=1490864 RepID=UPI002620EC21|nr:ADP-ribosylglycohydrolase family protein [uncultured Pluralibacter sp.]